MHFTRITFTIVTRYTMYTILMQKRRIINVHIRSCIRVYDERTSNEREIRSVEFSFVSHKRTFRSHLPVRSSRVCYDYLFNILLLSFLLSSHCKFFLEENREKSGWRRNIKMQENSVVDSTK